MTTCNDNSIALRLPPPALPGQLLGAIDTPSLVLDLDVFERRTRARETRMSRRMRSRTQTSPWFSPVKGEASRSARMATRSSASGSVSFGPRRIG